MRCAVFKVCTNRVCVVCAFLLFLKCSSRDRDHGGPEGMEPDGVIEVIEHVDSPPPVLPFERYVAVTSIVFK